MTNVNEKWVSIPNYPNYEISDLGRVKSIERVTECGYNSKRFRPEKILIPFSDKKGYVMARLYNNGKHKTLKVHRLVAKLFVSGFEEGKEVNHINGIKHDNRAINLEWVTPKENVRHAIKTGLKVFVKGENNHRNKKVIAVFEDGTKKEYYSMSNAAKELNTNRDSIWRVLKGLRKQNNGVVFKYG